MARHLSGQAGDSHRERRVYTASYLQLSGAVQAPALRRIALQLSRHYTDDYRVAEACKGIEFVADFDNIVHAFSIEGCATVVDTNGAADRNAPKFLVNYKTKTFDRHYLPLVLVSLHELNTLLSLSNDARFWPQLADCTKDICRLEDLRDRILRFRLCYRFSHVSFISMHNAVNRALRSTFELDRVSDELKADTEEIQRYLVEFSTRRTERRFLWVSVIAATGLAWLTTFKVFKELIETTHAADHLTGGLIAVSAGLIAGAVAWWATWNRGKYGASHGKGHLAKHAELENVIHRH